MSQKNRVMNHCEQKGATVYVLARDVVRCWPILKIFRPSADPAISLLRSLTVPPQFSGVTTWGEVRQLPEAIASGRQAAGGRLEPTDNIFFVLQLNFERQKEVRRTNKTRMWANAQCDGRPAEYRWRPLLNAAPCGKFVNAIKGPTASQTCRYVTLWNSRHRHVLKKDNSRQWSDYCDAIAVYFVCYNRCHDFRKL